ncbi:MAG: 3-isopropylmalate dehydratase small subunit [Gammaproteobacteria bacterium]|jgi:3-isopropylmalate/(R)-2-methylmalate dehydratase small subunit|nr:3-isopropylmalate dehydratase small subunit [Gammaproteobacteria bacterium]MDG1231319.1 3-isopropylmalate dehydratase small subunit [Pseudomonadales bacterium]MBT5686451.1 3-isopropylmalate dehydratase small subunit [Gammaproteobacteria bacterium]MBT6585883.1 3-isopropylmalate dehydratase small subunit [Gammaproteobacteria bacterium]MBT6891250.1 3-isopropylmalate dehydratase small subunit [Gammaproteobacteria bacterium]
MSLSKLAGKGVYVQGNDIDTDRIIPARYLKCVTFDELGPSLFYDVRFESDGTSKGHALDAPQHKGAEILISDENFGCGSSREHAPQAIQKFGLKAVIAGSFAEIFHGNCTTLGIPCVVMDEASRVKLTADIENNPESEIIIDLEGMQVICANAIYPIQMKESTREAFLSSTFDPLDNLLGAKAEIYSTAKKLGYA